MKTKKILFDGHEYSVDSNGWEHSDTCWCAVSNKVDEADLLGKTHKFEMWFGKFQHSEKCWCMAKKEKLEAPDDNDGREVCYWCGSDTVRKQLFTSKYDFCERCQK